MDFLQDLIDLIAGIITLGSAVVAVIASRQSKRTARQAEAAKAETQSLINQYLASMTRAADSTAEANAHTRQQQDAEQLYQAIRQTVLIGATDFITLDGVRESLTAQGMVAEESQLADALFRLTQEGVLTKLNVGGPHCYHRLKKL